MFHGLICYSMQELAVTDVHLEELAREVRRLRNTLE